MTKTKFSETIIRNALNCEHRLKKLTEEGLSLGQIANELRIAPGTAARYLRVLDLPVPKHRKQRQHDKDEVIPKMLEMRQNGMSLIEIGKHFNVSRECVRQKLARWCPDIVLPTFIKKQRTCNHCGNPFTPVANHIRFCSTECGGLGRSKERWNRDTAEQMMRLRKEGKTWSEVAQEIGSKYNGTILRSRLQRHMHLFSSKEQEIYFPKHGEPFYKPSKETPSTKEENHDSLIVRILRKFTD